MRGSECRFRRARKGNRRLFFRRAASWSGDRYVPSVTPHESGPFGNGPRLKIGGKKGQCRRRRHRVRLGKSFHIIATAGSTTGFARTGNIGNLGIPAPEPLLPFTLHLVHLRKRAIQWRNESQSNAR